MSKKSLEIRCPKVHSPKGREIKCGRFLVQISDDEIRVRCPKCGTLYSIVRDEATGKLRWSEIPETSALISKKAE
jgi:phage FluMu protein Com